MLTVFTLEDRVDLQFFLNMPIEAIEEGSYLWSLLYEVEQRDRRLGTEIAITIQLELAKVKNLHCLIDNALASGSGDVGLASRESYLEGKESYNTNMGTLYSQQLALNSSLSNIKSWLGIARRLTGNRNRVPYPGGGVQSSGKLANWR